MIEEGLSHNQSIGDNGRKTMPTTHTLRANTWGKRQVYLSSSVKTVIVSSGPAIVKATVLPPDFLPHCSPMVHEAHEAFDPEGRRRDGESGHLLDKNKQTMQAGDT